MLDCWPRVSKCGLSFYFYITLGFLLGLLLQGDNTVQLVVLCAEKPTSTLLKRVVTELPIQLKKVSEEHSYTVKMAPVEGAVHVSDGTITVKVSLTSPLLREPQGKSVFLLVFFIFVKIDGFAWAGKMRRFQRFFPTSFFLPTMNPSFPQLSSNWAERFS